MTRRLWFLLFLRRNESVALTSLFIILVTAILGVAFYIRSQEIMEAQLKQNLRVSATLAAQQFEGMDFSGIRTRDDMQKPLYKEIVRRLNSVRSQIPHVQYAYLMRQSPKDMELEFVADADSLNTLGQLDANDDGVLGSEEEASYPGDVYEIWDVPALQYAAFVHPTVDDEITYDQWGAFISGYAPIAQDSPRETVVLGIDMDANEFTQHAQSIFSPVALLLVTIVGIMISSLVVFVIWRRRVQSLRRTEEERTALIRLASHQLGAPLATFRWWLEILSEQIDCDQGGACQEMAAAVERMGEIVTSLQQAGQLASPIQYKAQAASICDIIEKIVKDVESKRKLKNHQITKSIDCAMEMQLDPKLIGGLIRELLDNAIDYSPAGSTIHISCQHTDTHVTVRVSDEGCGIPEKDMGRIFQKFVRASNAEKYKTVGNGMGLFIARSIVEHAGGKIWFESTEGKGTTFIFTLPIR